MGQSPALSTTRSQLSSRFNHLEPEIREIQDDRIASRAKITPALKCSELDVRPIDKNSACTDKCIAPSLHVECTAPGLENRRLPPPRARFEAWAALAILRGLETWPDAAYSMLL